MVRTLLTTSLIIIVVLAASVTTAPAIFIDQCLDVKNSCLDECSRGGCCRAVDAGNPTPDQEECCTVCQLSCYSLYEVCRVSGGGDSSKMPPSTPPTVAPPTSGLQPPPVAPTQPSSGGTGPITFGGPQPPGKTGTQPPSTGGGTTPPGLTGVHPVYPVGPNPGKVNEPGTGNPTGTTGNPPNQIYAIKPPEVTTSPIGITTTTVYDEKGDSTKTLKDPTGKVLETITTTHNPNGGSKTTTANAAGNVLNTKVTKSDGTSILYNSAGKIISKGKITSTGTGGTYTSGKGHKEGYMGQTSQKHKEFSHEQKHNVKEQNWGSTPAGAYSSPTPSHGHGGHR